MNANSRQMSAHVDDGIMLVLAIVSSLRGALVYYSRLSIIVAKPTMPWSQSLSGKAY
jgi:hypothetical protein